MYPKLSIYGQISKIGLIVLGSLIAFGGAFGPLAWAIGPEKKRSARKQGANLETAVFKPGSRLRLVPGHRGHGSTDRRAPQDPVTMNLLDGSGESRVDIWPPGSRRAIDAAVHRGVRKTGSSRNEAQCLLVSAQHKPESLVSDQYVLNPGEFVQIRRRVRLADGRTLQTGVVVENSDQGVSFFGLGNVDLGVWHPPEFVADVLPKLSNKELIISAASALVVGEKRATSGLVFSADRQRRYRDGDPIEYISIDHVGDLLSSRIKDDPNRLVCVIQSSGSLWTSALSLRDLLRKAHQREPGAPEEKISEGDRLLAVRLPRNLTGFVQPKLLEKIAPVLDQIGRSPLHVVATDVAKMLAEIYREDGTPVNEDIELALMYLGHEPYGL